MGNAYGAINIKWDNGFKSSRWNVKCYWFVSGLHFSTEASTKQSTASKTSVQLTSQSFIVHLYLCIPHVSSHTEYLENKTWWVGNDALQTRVLAPAPSCWVTSCPYLIGGFIPLCFTSFQLRNKGAKEILIILLKLWDGHVRRPSTVPGTSLHPGFIPFGIYKEVHPFP